MSIITGIGPTSGINYDQIIRGLLNLERRPITNLQQRQAVFNTQVGAYSELSNGLSALRSAADALRTVDNFYVRAAASSNTTVLTATASSSAAVGIHTIEPFGGVATGNTIQLASADRRSGTTVVSSPTTIINSSGANRVFEYTYAGATRTLTVANNTTLEGLRNIINNDTANPGVTASIVQVATNDHRLVLTGRDTGALNAITITANTTLTGAGGTMNFTNTAFTASTARDARFRVGGLDITRSTNTVADVIAGVTFTLRAESTSSVTISVTNDTAAIRGRIESFVNAYNEVVSFVSQRSTYDRTTNTGGPFFAESTPRDIVNRLRDIATREVAGLPDGMRSLAQIGITTNHQTGALSINTSMLDGRLSTDLAGVANIFTNAAGGIAVRVHDYTGVVTNPVDGAITLRTRGLNSLITNISNDIIRLEERLVRTEENLRRQFTALESIISGMMAQQSYLTNLINSWQRR
jgi:flagellar hook-associated protein 2